MAYRNFEYPLKAIWPRLKVASAAALISNPLDAAINANGSFVDSATHDATLTTQLVTPPTHDAYFAYHGGTKTKFPGQNWNLFPVSDHYPAVDGNLNGYLSYNLGLQGAYWEVEFMTDALTPEVKFLSTGTSQGFAIVVDGQYLTNKTGTAAGAAGTRFVKMTFTGSRKVRRIQFRTSAANGWGGVSVLPTDSIWAPPQNDVITAAFTGDSYAEGQGLTVPWNPGAFFPVVASDLLGWRDPRLTAVGSTGYLTTGGRSIVRAQLDWWDFTPDVVVVAAGANDTAFSDTAVGNEAYETFKKIRAKYPQAPLFVFGPWAKFSGPSAGVISREVAIQNAFNTFSDPNSFFFPMNQAGNQWITGTGYIGATNGSGNSDFYIKSDGHPVDIGHEYIGRRVADCIRGVINSYT